jgi:hypothetical protein
LHGAVAKSIRPSGEPSIPARGDLRSEDALARNLIGMRQSIVERLGDRLGVHPTRRSNMLAGWCAAKPPRNAISCTVRARQLAGS